jgi:hypothetical protein
MSDEQRREPNWRDYETFEDAARRLIGVMDERAKKRKTLAGGDLGAGTNSDQQRWSPTAEKCGSPELKRSAKLDGLPQSTAP